MTHRFYFLLLLFCTTLQVALGQKHTISFKHITAEDGLSQNHVNYLLKDSRGFIWIGTQDGLNRYDAYQFQHFHHHTDDTTSLSNNYIWCLLEDSNDDIWVGSFGGELCRFNRDTETFQSISLKPFTQPTIVGNSVRTLLEFPEGTLWIGADKGVWSLDIASFALKQHDVQPTDFQYNEQIPRELLNVVSLHPLTQNQLLVGAGQGLFRLYMDSGRFQSITNNGQLITGNGTIINGSNNDFWIGAMSGLYHLTYFSATDSIVVDDHFYNQENDPKSLPGNRVNDLYLDDNNILWVGTNEGLSKLDITNLLAGFQNFLHKADDPTSVSNDMIFNILEVEPGLIWVGTRGGISIFSNEPSAFKNINYKNTAGQLCADAILGMLEDKEDNLWICTREGLTCISNFSKGKEEWKFTCLTPENTPSMPHHYVINIAQDAKGELWCGFRRNGFAKLKKSRDGKWMFQKINQFNDLLLGAGMNSILFDSRKNTWLATPGHGLIKWNLITEDYEVYNADTLPGYLKHDYIFCLHEDHENQIWVGSANGGLCLYNRKNNNFQCFVHDNMNEESISSNMVLSIFQDSHNRLWACSANGLNLMEASGKFRRFFQKDGLPNEVIYGMLEDNKGHLWVSTNKGISKIKFQENQLSTENFTPADGIPGFEFNQHAFLKTKAGELVFGGVKGLTVFNPDAIQPYPHRPSPVLTDFQLFNKSVEIGSFLKKAINEETTITLPYHQNFLAFEFAALGFTQPENNEFAYMLEGLESDWILSGKRRYAGYPNLQPGDYTFKVKAANHDGIWNETPKALQIRIKKPWWKTWWANAIYLLVIASTIFLIIHSREQSLRKIEQAKTLEREQFRKRTARDFHDEAGNKITKISLMTEVVKRQVDQQSPVTAMLIQIEENIQELRSGMRDFIWVLDPENDNLYDTLLRLKDFGNNLFEYSDCRFSTVQFDDKLQKINLNGNQRRHLLLIFKEAMNNCLKYANAKNATLEAKQVGNRVQLLFADDGKGFNIETARGNGLKNMQARAKKMNAELHIKIHSGTKVSLLLSNDITHLGN